MLAFAGDVPQNEAVIEREVIEHFAPISAENLLHVLERSRLRDDQLAQPRRFRGQARCGLAIRFFQVRDLLLRRLDF